MCMYVTNDSMPLLNYILSIDNTANKVWFLYISCIIVQLLLLDIRYIRVKEYFPSTNTFRAVLLGSLVYNINVYICVHTLGNLPRIMIQLKYS